MLGAPQELEMQKTYTGAVYISDKFLPGGLCM